METVWSATRDAIPTAATEVDGRIAALAVAGQGDGLWMLEASGAAMLAAQAVGARDAFAPDPARSVSAFPPARTHPLRGSKRPTRSAGV